MVAIELSYSVNLEICSFQQKEEFVKARLAAKRVTAGGGEDHQVTQESLTPEEMSEFYKKFLDENFKQHLQYNK